ncbi:hypothetical protein [Actibacterium lipolyticum]|uniref:Uncharacterized protein n=1 Tax=Actibacterium lipolyticum TaxID=1524263 RepID=A0A238JKD2_9RHOB|nr:hypothetical protein [Actibacterium lipolyticum]SMX30647.1 hypothetical protein COL8621_00008 [Actibacterium lipolyticum]
MTLTGSQLIEKARSRRRMALATRANMNVVERIEVHLGESNGGPFFITRDNVRC